MNVPVVVVAFAGLLAQFVIKDTSSILEGMDYVVFKKKGECAENARFVQRHHCML